MRIRSDFSGEQRRLKLLDECSLVANGQFGRQRAINRRRAKALVLHGRQRPGSDRRFNRRCRNAHGLCFHDRPAASALLAGAVENDIHQRFAGLGVIGGKNPGGNFDQIGIQRAGIPVSKDLPDLLGTQTQPIAQHAVDFGDHLHVGIFDAVVDHFDEMASAITADPGAAGIALEFGGDGIEYGRDPTIRGLWAADHDGWAMPRAFFATGNTQSNEIESRASQGRRPRNGIAEIGVASVDNDVAGRQKRLQMRDLLIHRIARLYHDNNWPGRAD